MCPCTFPPAANTAIQISKCIGSSSFTSSKPITFSITASYEGPPSSADVGFTVTVYSTTPATWDQSVRRLPYEVKVRRLSYNICAISLVDTSGIIGRGDVDVEDFGREL